MKGHIILRYIDNLFLLGKAYNLCVTNVMDTFTQCDSLGFSIYPDKSVNTFPKTSFVGFIIGSLTMSITLTPDKAESV